MTNKHSKKEKREDQERHFPDFTKGAWKTQPPLGIETVDLSKMGLCLGDVKKDKAALNV